MGCGGTKVEEPKPSNSDQKKEVKKHITKVETLIEEQTIPKVELQKIDKELIEISYYVLEVISNNEIQFKEKEKIQLLRNNQLNTFSKLMKTDEKSIIKDLSKEKMEYLIYGFLYNNGTKNICNYYDVEGVDLAYHTNSSLEVNSSAVKTLDSNKKPENSSSEELFVYSIWLVDIENIEIEPDQVVDIIKDKPGIKDMKLFCKNLGEVYIEQEPDLNDDGIVVDDSPSDSKEIVISKELDRQSLESAKESLEKEYIKGFHIRRNKFNEPSNFISVLNMLKSTNSDRITSFTFSDNLNLGDGWHKVIDVIAELKNLHYLNLSMGFIYDKYLVPLLNSIKSKRIVQLDLSSNFITYVGAKTISKWIKGNRTLKELYLQQNTMNEFKKEGFAYISDALKVHPNITSVDFSFMILTGFGSNLSELVKCSRTLKVLKIRNVRMNFKDFEYLIPALSENATIEELYLNENNPMKDEVIDLIAKLINSNKTIHTLYLDKIGLNVENSKPFFTAMKKNTTIHTLSINDNPDLNIKKFVEFLRESTTLKKVFYMNRNSNVKKNKDDLVLVEKLKEERPDLFIKV
jgi:hypothetical protein